MNVGRRKLMVLLAAVAMILIPTATAARIGGGGSSDPGAIVPIFAGGLASGFADWSWAATDHGSTLAVEFEHDADALFLANPAGVALGADPELGFEVSNPGPSAVDIQVMIFGAGWVPASSHELTVPPGGPWRHRLPAGAAMVTGIWWQEAGDATTAELDFGAIALASSPDAPPTTTPGATSVLPTTVIPTTVPSTTVPSTTVLPTTPSSTEPPTPTTAPSTTTSSTTTGPPSGERVLFFEDFADGGSLARFDFGIYHRDDHVNADNTSWPGDHAVTGPNDLCGPPEENRTITRGDRASGFNNDWIYRCVPMGNRDLAHIMTSIGDTSGYSIGSFTPKESFTNVREVRWEVNITELGNRQFPEVKLIPVDSFDFDDIPCAVEWLPCDTSLHRELGSLGVSFQNHEMTINDGTDSRSMTSSWGGDWLEPGDPAVDSIRTRRTHFFRDNEDGTLSFGIEKEDGTFHVESRPGRFPDGPVRVVFADHNYTPLKAENGRPSTFSWHWDDITVLG